MTAYGIDAPVLREVKRLIGQSAPHVKSSHRTEALARGLGFNTNAALQAALDQGPVQSEVSRVAFEGFLRERGYDIEKLQLSLLPDALILACGDSLKEPKAPPGGKDHGQCLECPFCLDVFVRQGFHNRICHECSQREGRVPGVHKVAEVTEAHLSSLLERGKPQNLDRLRARPGWSDTLDGEDFLAKSAQALRIRAILNDGDPAGMAARDRQFRSRYDHLPINQPWAQPGYGEPRPAVL